MTNSTGDVAGDPASAAAFAGASFFDPEIQRCPYAYYQWLRETEPVRWDASLGAYVLSTDELVRSAALDWRTFSNVGSQDFGASTSSASEAARIRATTYTTKPLTVCVDPPEHSQYRRVISTTLSPKRMLASKPWIERTASELVGEMLRRGGGDFVEEVAVALPFALILHLMGLPSGLIDKMRAWAASYIEPLTGKLTPERDLECAHLYVEYHEFFERLIEERRTMTDPPDDLVTGVALARLADGELLSMVDALSIVEQFVTAGAETTTSALGMGAFALVQRPELLAQIRNDEGALEAFVEEVLRLYAPAQGLFRVTTRDVELAGVNIPAGSKVMIRWAAANTDPTVYADAEQIDLGRRELRKHMTFGYGIHACAGAALARLEMAATFKALAEQVEAMSIDEAGGGVEHVEGIIFMGLRRLPVTMRPREA